MNHSIRSNVLLSAAALSIAGLSLTSAMAETKESFNKSYPASNGGKLIVDVDFGGLEVVSGNGTEVKIHVDRSVSALSKEKEESFLADRPIEVTQDGSTFTIRSLAKTKLSGWSWGKFRNMHARYTIEVPSQFNTKLHTSGGGIEIKGLTGENDANTSGGGLKFSKLDGSLNGRTSGGGVDVNECKGSLKVSTSGGGIKVRRSSGTIDAKTSGGGITVDGFDGPADVDTSGGGLHLDDITGKVHGHTSGGSIHAKLLSDKPDADLSTSGGGITVAVNSAASFNLDASTSAGSVSCDLPITIEGKKKSDQLRGAVNGGGSTVKLRSSAGGIHVVK